VEVAASSASYDLHVKREVYRRNGCESMLCGACMTGK